MLMTRKVPERKDLVAVSFDGPVEIFVRNSGKQFFGKEKLLCKVSGNKLIVRQNALEEFGLELCMEEGKKEEERC